MAFDGAQHGVEAVGAGHGEVVAESDIVDEIGLGVDDLSCGAA